MTYAYTPYIWLPFFTVLFLIALAIYSGRRRSVPGALPFMAGCLFAALWAAGSVMEYAAADFTTKVFWVKFQGACQVPTAIAVTCFILEYAWPGRWLTRRNLALLSIPALLLIGLILTNNSHHLIWHGFEYDGSIRPRPQLNTIGWIGIAYGYALAVIDVIVFAWLLLRSPQHRWPVVVMLTGLLGGRIIYLLGKTPAIHADLSLAMLGMAFEFLMYAIALFGFRIFDPISLARQTVIAQMREGMLVLDPQGRVASLNPAAQAILGAAEKQLHGRPIHELLPGLGGDLQAGQTEICLPDGPETRDYQLEVSPLNDWRGSNVGRLLMLQDVTGQKQAQAQLIQQQRALAMLKEDEQLARELHDSIAQVLGYAGFQLESIQLHVAAGQAALAAGQPAQANANLEQAADQLTRLGNIVADAHADLREVILNLRLAPSEQQEFFTSLQHYLDSFSTNYGLQAGLSAGPGADPATLDPGVQMQLFRIIQEALSNTRKHARASRVQVAFEKQAGRLLIQIQDNGQGFDPAQAASASGNHLGLRFMRERTAGIGGSLWVQSAPGAGTCVELELPIEGNKMELA